MHHLAHGTCVTVRSSSSVQEENHNFSHPGDHYLDIRYFISEGTGWILGSLLYVLMYY